MCEKIRWYSQFVTETSLMLIIHYSLFILHVLFQIFGLWFSHDIYFYIHYVSSWLVLSYDVIIIVCVNYLSSFYLHSIFFLKFITLLISIEFMSCVNINRDYWHFDFIFLDGRTERNWSKYLLQQLSKLRIEFSKMIASVLTVVAMYNNIAIT